MRPSLLTLAALPALLCPALAAKLDGTFIGSVGSAPVVARLESGESGDSAYYYRRVGVDIPLEVSVNGDRVSITERGLAPNENDVRARVTARLENGAIAGTYTRQPDGARLPFRLRPVNAADLKSPILAPLMQTWRREDPYTFLKFDAAFQAGKTVTVNGRSLRWFTEPKSKLEFVRAEGAGREKLNAALADEHLAEARDALACSVDAGSGGWEHEVKPTFFSDALLSVRVYNFAYCGGAHPDGWPASVTFDARSGKRVRLEDLYRFAPVPAGLNVEKMEPFDAFERYAAARAAVLKRVAYAANPALKKSECWGANFAEDAFRFLEDYYLVPGAVVFQGSFPHVADACESEEVRVPFARLEPYRAPGSPYRL